MSADVAGKANTVTRKASLLCAGPACWLLAVALVIPSSRASDQLAQSLVADGSDRKTQSPKNNERSQDMATASLSWAAAPRPAPANPKVLAAAFSKPAPASLADLKAIEQHVEALVHRVSPAVVALEVGYSTGSGVVVSSDGLVLTAGHVCGKANREALFTFPDGRVARGKTLGLNRDKDTGLARITDLGPWPHVAVGDLDQSATGTWVLALGHPGGFDLKRSLVVRLGRIVRIAPGGLQTDCTISPGDSGGPLFDMYGRVIGIHSAISESLAENFHVPITEYYDTWVQLVKGSKGDEDLNSKGYFGAAVADDPTGCRVSTVEKNSPASRAGVKVGDIVLKVEGREIRKAATFQRWVAETQPGEWLTLEIRRGGALMSFNVKLELRSRRN